MQYPKLDQEAVTVLHVIKDRGVINGGQLMSETGLPMDKLMHAVDDLTKSELISCKGNIYNQSEFLNSYFNIRPSNFGLSDFLIKTS
jgi:hypothetical protein